jgi:hypothetical protein
MIYTYPCPVKALEKTEVNATRVYAYSQNCERRLVASS